MPKTRHAVIGGFLGSGKTTIQLLLAEYLKTKGCSSGLITNDQSVGLVDTARVRSAGFAVREITGSCFCCNFNGLLEMSDDLVKKSMPQVILAEAVGSCTDLKATVNYPLRTKYPDTYDVAPFTVVADPRRLGTQLGFFKGKTFSHDVQYIYDKQLEEAEIIVINKSDLVPRGLHTDLVDATKLRYPQAKVFLVSCKGGQGLKELFDEILLGTPNDEPSIELDYDQYAAGEALMGWLNTTATVPIAGPYQGDGLMFTVAEKIQKRLVAAGVEVAHLKLSLATGEGSHVGSVSITQNGEAPQLVTSIGTVSEKAELTINLRAEADPILLKDEVEKALDDLGLAAEEIHAFRPGRPNPTHRMASLDEAA